ncbi:MAG: hypothetical protein IT437_05440 [Phycisphaerales bacterium]|nr:hypothetical protein [Phycisphaerales bacterium]
MQHARTSEQPESRSSDPSRLTREQVVDRIMHLNPTAGHEFLRDFEEDELSLYLERLTAATRPRGRFARWERRPGPGISTRQAG